MYEYRILMSKTLPKLSIFLVISSDFSNTYAPKLSVCFLFCLTFSVAVQVKSLHSGPDLPDTNFIKICLLELYIHQCRQLERLILKF